MRAFDPFGLDGYWWHETYLLDAKEPKPPETFKVLLGALSLRDRSPTEVIDDVVPGPDVPFVVPRLLRLPGMVAVLAKRDLTSGDTAWMISYWSRETIAARSLHQPWLRQDMWIKHDDGPVTWKIANDEWDYDLRPYVDDGRLLWLDSIDGSIRRATAGDRCPFLDIPGGRRPQVLAQGQRSFQRNPDGTALNPFAD
ncbi:MAG: hypothetical protein H0W72_00255 [Planctomycetes bacterium]|nr:hypothetical protein [Planctomycetota bacterium]